MQNIYLFKVIIQNIYVNVNCFCAIMKQRKRGKVSLFENGKFMKEDSNMNRKEQVGKKPYVAFQLGIVQMENDVVTASVVNNADATWTPNPWGEGGNG